MHSFPWYYDAIFIVLSLLTMWQTWVVLGAAVGGFLWYKKNKKKHGVDN